MDTIWTQLPNELVLEVCKHLDPATRRDIGMKPRRLTELPRLNFHFHEHMYGGDATSVFFTKDDISTFIIKTVGVFSCERTERFPMMTVNGILIYGSRRISLT
jgi:hypothetical protein